MVLAWMCIAQKVNSILELPCNIKVSVKAQCEEQFVSFFLKSAHADELFIEVGAIIEAANGKAEQNY